MCTSKRIVLVKLNLIDKILRVLKFSLWRLEALESWDKESIHKEFQMLSGQMDLKFREFLSPLLWR